MKFMKIAGLLLLCIHLLGPQRVLADEYSDIGSSTITMKDFFMNETAIVIMSTMAASSPNDFGRYMAVGIPLVFLAQNFEERHNGRAYWLSSLIAMESLAIYNLSIEKDKVSEIEIFRNNFVAFNLLFAIDMTLGQYFAPKKSKRYSYSIFPMNGGGYAQLNYRF